ncbi:MAG: 4a-hydroxytetrahydrobiopterin dehydratase [Candidatus Yanofskybacteria bacterium]|nr:4a-hydroxytetrahydrobiopterin dehydratase [Candidatus Yanofskybacteria bacterium]
MELAKKTCVPCQGGVTPLQGKEIQEYLAQLPAGWEQGREKSIKKQFVKKNFADALSFINKIGEIAEHEGHHPDLRLFAYKKVEVELSTHAIGGLSENDFILAAKIEKL